MLSSKLTLRICLLILLYFWGNLLLGHEHEFLHYGVDDGLPSSHIYDAMQDQNGYIWIGTDMGISQFDGYVFKNYTTADGLPHNDIWGFFEDSKGRIWLETFGPDFYYIKNGSIQRVENNVDFFHEEHTPMVIFKYKEDKKGAIWVKMGIKVFKYFDGQLKIIPLKYDAENNNKYFEEDAVYFDLGSIYVERNDSLIFYREAFYRKKNQNKEKPIYPNSLHLTKDTSLCVLENKVYLSTKDNLIEVPLLIKGCNGNPRLFLGANGTYFLGCEEGVAAIDKNFKLINDFPFLNNLKANRLFQDDHQNLWICTSNKGLHMLSTKSLQTETYRTARDPFSVTAIAKDQLGNIWFGTNWGEVYIFENDKLTLLDSPPEKDYSKSEWVRDISLSSNNRLHIIYNNSTVRIVDPTDPEKILPLKYFHSNTDDYDSHYTSQYQPTYHSPKDLSKNISDTLWMASVSGLLAWFERDKKTYQLDRCTKQRCYAVEVDNNDKVWVGQTTGLITYHHKKIDSLFTLKKQHPTLEKNIKSIAIDDQNTKWIGTDGFGLIALQGDHLQFVPALKNQIIKKVFVDSEQTIWVATNIGLARVNPESLETIFYTTAQGLASNEVHCIYVDKEHIYAGTNNGLTIIPREQQKAFSNPPPFYINKLLIRGESHKINKEDTTFYFDLTYHQNELQISYSCLSYESDKKITYEYKMSGIDSDWKSTKQLQLEYLSLRHGKEYTFEIKAKDINQKYADRSYKLTFNIAPPFWETGWFILLTALIIGLFTFFLIFYGIHKFKEKEKEREREREKEKEKEKIINNKKFAELKLQALQAQMNPHFIFNALQAIQDFVAGKDERSTNRYMYNFAKLIRLVLESSKKKHITLEDEIQLLELYVGLEQLRFDPPFEYLFEIPKSVDSSAIYIPSMLLQPFVENAINHGLRYKTNQGFLKVQIEQFDNQLNIEITDNGVGREKARSIKKLATKSYKSRGMNMIQEKLNTLQFIYETEIRIEIEDRIQNQQVKGTIVKLVVPILDKEVGKQKHIL